LPKTRHGCRIPPEYHPTADFSPPTLIYGVDFNTAEILEYIKEVELLTEDQRSTLDELGGLRKVGGTLVFDCIRDYFREGTGLKDRFEIKVELSGGWCTRCAPIAIIILCYRERSSKSTANSCVFSQERRRSGSPAESSLSTTDLSGRVNIICRWYVCHSSVFLPALCPRFPLPFILVLSTLFIPPSIICCPKRIYFPRRPANAHC